MFSLVSARYERASLILTSNKPFSACDEVTAVAMIDRLVLPQPAEPRAASRRNPVLAGIP